jgi:hypothetical protein
MWERTVRYDNWVASAIRRLGRRYRRLSTCGEVADGGRHRPAGPVLGQAPRSSASRSSSEKEHPEPVGEQDTVISEHECHNVGHVVSRVLPSLTAHGIGARAEPNHRPEPFLGGHRAEARSC